MQKKNTIFDFQESILFIFSVSIIFISVFCILLGENAKEMSTIFSLGNQGISINILIEFFVLSIFISIYRWIFFTDGLIKNLSIGLRCVLMYISTTVTAGIFAAMFKWFPINMVKPWIMFFISFLICSIVSTFISLYRDKVENKKMQDALDRIKEER